MAGTTASSSRGTIPVVLLCGTVIAATAYLLASRESNSNGRKGSPKSGVVGSAAKKEGSTSTTTLAMDRDSDAVETTISSAEAVTVSAKTPDTTESDATDTRTISFSNNAEEEATPPGTNGDQMSQIDKPHLPLVNTDNVETSDEQVESEEIASLLLEKEPAEQGSTIDNPEIPLNEEKVPEPFDEEAGTEKPAVEQLPNMVKLVIAESELETDNDGVQTVSKDNLAPLPAKADDCDIESIEKVTEVVDPVEVQAVNIVAIEKEASLAALENVEAASPLLGSESTTIALGNEGILATTPSPKKNKRRRNKKKKGTPTKSQSVGNGVWGEKTPTDDAPDENKNTTNMEPSPQTLETGVDTLVAASIAARKAAKRKKNGRKKKTKGTAQTAAAKEIQDFQKAQGSKK